MNSEFKILLCLVKAINFKRINRQFVHWEKYLKYRANQKPSSWSTVRNRTDSQSEIIPLRHYLILGKYRNRRAA